MALDATGRELVESALAKTGKVSTSVVIATPGDGGAPVLAAFVVPSPVDLRALPPGQRWVSPNRLELAVHNRIEAAYFYREIFERECYLAGGVTLDGVDVVFDVGANIGMFSLFVASRRPGARIFSFEPVPTLFRMMERNLRAHRVKAKAVNCALGDRSGKKILTFYPRSSGMSTFEPKIEEESEILLRHVEVARRSGQRGIDLLMGQLDGWVKSRLAREDIAVPMRTLSDVIDGEGVEAIDLLKIDVQKTELQVLQGIRDDQWGRIRQMALEVHDLRGRLSALQALLETRGFAVTVCQDEDLAGTALHNIYAVTEGPLRGGPPAAEELGAAGYPRPVGDSALVADLKRILEAGLPAALVPASFTVLPYLPMTPENEVDLSFLARLARTGH